MRLTHAKSIFALAGGIAAGTAAMYLLDPSAGRRRRAAIVSAANYTVHHAGDAVHYAGDAIRDAAVSAGEKIGDIAGRARRGGEHVAGAAAPMLAAAIPAASHLATTATGAAGLRRLVDSYHDSAHYLAERVDQLRQTIEPHQPARISSFAHAGKAWLTPAMRHAKSAIRRVGGVRGVAMKGPMRVVPITIGGVACLAAGAGAMYWFDPDRGWSRRQALRDGTMGMVRKMGQFAHRRGQSARANVQGIARQVGLTAPARVSSRDYVSGEQLLLRVRGQIARTTGSPRMIQVMTDTFGSVTLTGDIIESEHERVVSAVRQTPGVRQVIDRLDVQVTPSVVPAAARGGL